MNRDDYLAQDAVGLADLIARREVGAAEVLDAALAATEAANPRINAVTRLMEGEARATIAGGAPAGPLGGVPFLLKDLGAQYAGVPTTGGSRLLADVIPAADSALVAAYRRAGLVIFGKTNTPEFGLEPVTESELLGPCRNPWDLTRTSGGSSGGAAAAVAAGILPAAHATDGGGSIRVPAACCGLFGLKPSRGRVSFAPADEGWGGFSNPHAVTRSVRDSAALLDAVCQPVPGDPYWMAPPATPFAAEVGRDPGKLRVAVFTGGVASPTIDPVCAGAVRDAAALLESLGHQVSEGSLPDGYATIGQAGSVVVAANVAAMLDTEAARRGRAIAQGEIEPLTALMHQRGKGIAATAYLQALQAVHAYGRAVAAWFEDIDILLLATAGAPAIPLNALREGDPRAYAERLFAFMPNTQVFNITGQPAMSLPLAWSEDGLPIGVQCVGRMGEEATLFRLAGQIEQAAPWAHRRPPAFA